VLLQLRADVRGHLRMRPPHFRGLTA